MTFYVYAVARDGPRATSLEVMEFNQAMEITAHQELYDILEEALINEVLAITSGCQDQSQNISTLESLTTWGEMTCPVCAETSQRYSRCIEAVQDEH